MFDLNSVLTAFFDLPRWAEFALLIMAFMIVLMIVVLGVVRRSRRRALLKVEELVEELAQTKAKLSSETRWRLADEDFRSRAGQAPQSGIAASM